VNIFVDSAKAKETLTRLPDGVTVTEKDVADVERTGQTRLDWDGTPVDVFLNNLPLHRAVAAAVVWVPLVGREIPVLDCASLAIFKAFFSRTKDWADLEAIAAATPKDIEAASATIAELVGAGDPAVGRLNSLVGRAPGLRSVP
jgi:hypothetical protein